MMKERSSSNIEMVLRRERHDATNLELDQLKQTTIARTSRHHGGIVQKGVLMRSRAVTLALTALLIGGTTAGGIAAGGGKSGNSSACSQYRPGNGFGDKNHIHYGPPGHGNTNPCTGSGPGN